MDLSLQIVWGHSLQHRETSLHNVETSFPDVPWGGVYVVECLLRPLGPTLTFVVLQMIFTAFMGSKTS